MKTVHAIFLAIAILMLGSFSSMRAQVSGDLAGLRQVLKIAKDLSVHESVAEIPTANCSLNALLANLSDGEESPIRKDLQVARSQYEVAARKLLAVADQKISKVKLRNFYAPNNEFENTKLVTKTDVLRMMANKSWDSVKAIDTLLGGAPALEQIKRLVSNASDLNKLILVLYDLPQHLSSE